MPVLILSGGEPLLRPDIFEISARAKAMGFYVGLSTNGTLIDGPAPIASPTVGYDYVGISLDGIGAVARPVPPRPGAYDAALRGIRLCREHGIKVGLRFTMTERNVQNCPPCSTSWRRSGIDKFYLSHLVYAGRGNRYRGDDAYHRTTRAAMDLMFERCWDVRRAAATTEFVTGNNDADGVYFLIWVRERFPERAEHIRAKLEQWGGNSSGVNVANIDNLGNVHPDTFWWHYSLGNVTRAAVLARSGPTSPTRSWPASRRSRRQIKGRCGACRLLRHLRRQHAGARDALTGDAWAEDPACYLTDEEIGRRPRRRASRYAYRSAAVPRRCWPLAPALAAAARCRRPARGRDPGRRARLYASTVPSCHGAVGLGGRAGAAAGESRPAQAREDGRRGHRQRPRRDADAGVRPERRARRSTALASYL